MTLPCDFHLGWILSTKIGSDNLSKDGNYMVQFLSYSVL